MLSDASVLPSILVRYLATCEQTYTKLAHMGYFLAMPELALFFARYAYTRLGDLVHETGKAYGLVIRDCVIPRGRLVPHRLVTAYFLRLWTAEEGVDCTLLGHGD
jgi:hypothetical protein